MNPILLIGIFAVGILAIAFLFLKSGGDKEKRLQELSGSKPSAKPKFDFRTMLFGTDDLKDRRRQVMESLEQIEQRARSKAKRRSLAELLDLSDLQMSLSQLRLIFLGLGVALSVPILVFKLPLPLAPIIIVVVSMFAPRFYLNKTIKKRERKFIEILPDAIDVMVRALRSGLPISDAMKLIGSEAPDPVGREFRELVEGQRIGISLDQGLERMYERLQLREINFLQIVITIQMKSGGNLSEALGNLSKVLRERRRMKGKVLSASQEARSSAMIIGSLPFVIIGGLSVMSADYLTPLWNTTIGNLVAVGALAWMGLGVFVMSQMIKLDI